MALPRETIKSTKAKCNCGAELEEQVLRSVVGYYIGFSCPNCGPCSRESGYYGTRKEAESAWIDRRYSR